MGEKPSDNRRRISQNLLDEIESFDGKDFSEQLLKWKNSSDKLSDEEIEKITEAIEKMIDGIETLTKRDIDKVVSRYV